MALDLMKIQKSLAGATLTDPRKIFTTLPRQSRFKRPSDEQADVLDGWFKNKDRKNNTIKMNTGAGKTVVGLMVLQSSLHDKVFPAVYVAPDKYLVEQTVKEAKDLGIPITQDEGDPLFLSGQSILVINIWKLINGRSVFGVREVKIPIGAIVIDDARACLTTVADQFKIKLPATNSVFTQLLVLFKEDLKQQSPTALLEIETGDPNGIMAVPFWAWKNRQDDVVRLFHEHRSEDQIKFAWPLIKDVFHLCQCVFGGKEFEIAPRFLPIDIIPAFTRAKRRIYMTATHLNDPKKRSARDRTTFGPWVA
jgi:replicative superfamily II helicase